MDSSYIMPFVRSIKSVFSMMLQMEVQVGAPQVRRGGSPSHDVSGIIALNGDVEGNVVLSFPTAVAVQAVERFTGMKLDVLHEDFADAVGELVNMISGSAKAEFTGKYVTISCPSVVIGAEHMVFGAKDMVCIGIPCAAACGSFVLEVGIKQMAASAKYKPATAAAAG